MKKVLSIVLSVMIVVIGIAPCAFAATPGIAMRATEGAYADDALTVSTVTEKVFTVVFKMPAVTSLVGFNGYVEFDDTVLKVVKGGQAGLVDDETGDITPIFNGTWASGMKTGTTDEYSMGLISSAGITKSAAKDFAYITFRVIDTSKAATTLNLYINELLTEDGNDDNEITATTLAESKIINFDFSELSEDDSTEEDTTEPVEADDINDLIQKIKDVLAGNGATWADVADAVTNILGNADLDDLLEQLIGGDINVFDGFLDKLKNIGLDFGALEDILNKIIDFIKNLFNGEETTKDNGNKTTTAVITTESASGDPATTSQGSQNGSEETGDAGIALAATVCVAAAAAFALTRKKKEVA